MTLGKNEIAIKGTIHFGTNNAELRPDGEQLLDEVADVMCKQPEIKQIRVEGHTDNRGNARAQPAAVEGARGGGGELPHQAGRRSVAARVARATARRSRWCRT